MGKILKVKIIADELTCGDVKLSVIIVNLYSGPLSNVFSHVMNLDLPVNFVIRNDCNNSCDTDAVCQTVSEQGPTSETSCLKTQNKQLIQSLIPL